MTMEQPIMNAEAARAAATPAPTQPPATSPIASPAVSSQAANVVPIQRPTPAPAGKPTLRLGVINERIAPLSIDAAGLAELGFPPAATEKAAKLYFEASYAAMVDAMVAALVRSKLKQQEAA